LSFVENCRLSRLYIDFYCPDRHISLGATLHAWRSEIALMWRFTRNNGITEGFHTKMESPSRPAIADPP